MNYVCKNTKNNTVRKKKVKKNALPYATTQKKGKFATYCDFIISM